MSNSTVTAKCQHCGSPLSPSHQGPCSVCGKVGKEVFAQIKEPPIRIRDSLEWKSTHEFYEKHHKWAALVIAITVVSSVLGMVPLGIWGVILGLLLGVISYYIGPKAETKVREVRYGQSTCV